ncbi:MAG: dienelactone hydrolase family protein [Acidobacteriota bacterium]|nr:dienelactone hydrolase family protein [Acidobacteriota bacterium]
MVKISPFLVLAGVLLASWADGRIAFGQPASELSRRTQPLEMTGDIASHLVAGADRFLLGKLENSRRTRARHWNRDFSSPGNYARSLEPNRKRLAHILGVRDPRVPFSSPELMATVRQSARIGGTESYDVFSIRWPSVGQMHGEGLLLVPRQGRPAADVIAVPDADQSPEQIAGLIPGVPAASQFARRLAESGCRVVVPALISRDRKRRIGRPLLTHREFIYRSAFELGRHLLGYEIQKLLALVDWFTQDAEGGDPRIGIAGYGEGGGLALYAAALDTRIDAALVSGYFSDRRNIWKQPIDRNVFGLLEQFGDAELASMIAPRSLIVEAARGPELTLPGEGGAPAILDTPPLETVRREVRRAQEFVAGLKPADRIQLVTRGPRGAGPAGGDPALTSLLGSLSSGLEPAPSGPAPSFLPDSFDPGVRMERQVGEMDRHNQWLLSESPYVRQTFMENLDTTSLEAYRKSTRDYREIFREEVIGWFHDDRLPFNPRTRPIYDAPGWTGHEVVLDVYPDVIAYGILLLPKDLVPGERRPVVVCQHGLEGRPQETIRGDHRAYHDFTAKLAERGFITFAPQNLYIFRDRFRTLQRKANPLKKSLFSIIAAQHQQILDWLKTLPWVDPGRIGFYGLSYGGKTAMRVPALLTDYALSICSADFNEWVWKNASSRARYSYVFHGEYEIFEFDLGSTFNYAEMAALIAPRPFMVERGHFDGVAPDEMVGYEFAKVRHLYSARLGLADRVEIEWFVGPHTINGQGTFSFLHKHLNWPEKRE